MIERVGSSTAETYVVATSFSRHDLPSVSGLTLAEMTASISGTTSAFSITEQHSLSAAIAASLIAGFVLRHLHQLHHHERATPAPTWARVAREVGEHLHRAELRLPAVLVELLERSGIMPSTSATRVERRHQRGAGGRAAICTGRALSATSCEGEGADG